MRLKNKMCDGKDRNSISCIKKNKLIYLDRCISLRVGTTHLNTLASCCGHNKYKKTLVIKKGKRNIEWYSQKEIPRTRRFYVKDKEGYYFIPEVEEIQKIVKRFGSSLIIYLGKEDCKINNIKEGDILNIKDFDIIKKSKGGKNKWNKNKKLKH